MVFDSNKHCRITENNSPVDIIFLHGFTSNKNNTEIIIKRWYSDKKYNIIRCDARGHGTRKNESSLDDWTGTVDDINALINQRNKDTIIIGGSMGGMIGLTVGLTNNHVKQVFAISSGNNANFIKDNKKLYEKRYGLRINGEEPHIVNALPINHTKCLPENSKKFFLIHAKNDPLIPFKEMEANKNALCLPDENVFIYDEDDFSNIGKNYNAHSLPSYSSKTHDFIKSKMIR